jgi:hypothetical protein
MNAKRDVVSSLSSAAVVRDAESVLVWRWVGRDGLNVLMSGPMLNVRACAFLSRLASSTGRGRGAEKGRGQLMTMGVCVFFFLPFLGRADVVDRVRVGRKDSQ